MVGWSYWGNLDVTSTLNGLVFIEPCNARWVWNEKNHGTYSKLAIACGIWYDDQPSGIWVEVEAWMDWTLGNSEIMRQILATSSWKKCSIFRPKVEGSTQYWMFGIPLWWLDEGVPCANFQRPGPDFFFPGQELRNELEEAMAEAPSRDGIRAKGTNFGHSLCWSHWTTGQIWNMPLEQPLTEAHLWLAEINGFLYYCFPSFSLMPHAHLKDKIAPANEIGTSLLIHTHLAFCFLMIFFSLIKLMRKTCHNRFWDRNYQTFPRSIIGPINSIPFTVKNNCAPP